MRILSSILILLAFLSCSTSNAQGLAVEGDLQVKGETPLLNQQNEKGERTGWWMLTFPARMGDYGYTEFGVYSRGRKYGQWYRMSMLGDLKAVETYRNNVLDGEVKYFENGHLAIVGHYRGLNPDNKYDTIDVVDPTTGLFKPVVIPTDRGTLRHGLWRYYDAETGRLMKEEDYQVDELIYEHTYPPPVMDSTAFKGRMRTMPHNKANNYEPPRGKRSMTR